MRGGVDRRARRPQVLKFNGGKISAFVLSAQGLLTTYLTARFGVLGVYIGGRSRRSPGNSREQALRFGRSAERKAGQGHRRTRQGADGKARADLIPAASAAVQDRPSAMPTARRPPWVFLCTLPRNRLRPGRGQSSMVGSVR